MLRSVTCHKFKINSLKHLPIATPSMFCKLLILTHWVQSNVLHWYSLLLQLLEMFAGMINRVTFCYGENTSFLSHWFASKNPLIVAFSKVPDFTVTLERSRYSLCPGTSAFGRFDSFWIFFCLALDLAQCSRGIYVPRVRTHPNSLAVFHMEFSF